VKTAAEEAQAVGSGEEGCSPPAARVAAVKEARGMAALD